MKNTLDKLQEWYMKQCNNDWEHEFGIKIDTIDNPGWVLTIDLIKTALQDKHFEPIDRQIASNNWVQCEIKNQQFIGYGGPQNLKDIIDEFLSFALLG